MAQNLSDETFLDGDDTNFWRGLMVIDAYRKSDVKMDDTRPLEFTEHETTFRAEK